MSIDRWWKNEFGHNTKVELETAIRNVVASYQDRAPLESDDAEFIDKVLRHHYQYAAKVGSGVRHIEVRTVAGVFGPTRCFWFVRTDGTEIDISWVVALKPGGRPSAKEDAAMAARYEILQQIHDYHDLVATKECEICGGAMGEGSHADHIIPFDTLLADWMATVGAQYVNIAVEDLGLVGRFADRTLAESWKQYHALNARLRIAHPKCNLQRGRK